MAAWRLVLAGTIVWCAVMLPLSLVPGWGMWIWFGFNMPLALLAEALVGIGPRDHGLVALVTVGIGLLYSMVCAVAGWLVGRTFRRK